MQLCIRASLVRLITRPLWSFDPLYWWTRGLAVCIQVGRVDYFRFLNGFVSRRPIHQSGKDRFVTPLFPEIVKCLWRATLACHISPAQAMATDKDYASHHPPDVNTHGSMNLGKEALYLRHLHFDQPEKGCSSVSDLVEPEQAGDSISIAPQS